MDVFCIDSVDIDSIECIRDPCLVSTVLTGASNSSQECVDVVVLIEYIRDPCLVSGAQPMVLSPAEKITTC